MIFWVPLKGQKYPKNTPKLRQGSQFTQKNRNRLWTPDLGKVHQILVMTSSLGGKFGLKIPKKSALNTSLNARNPWKFLSSLWFFGMLFFANNKQASLLSFSEVTGHHPKWYKMQKWTSLLKFIPRKILRYCV